MKLYKACEQLIQLPYCVIISETYHYEQCIQGDVLITTNVTQLPFKTGWVKSEITCDY